MSTVTEVSANRTRSSETSGMKRCEAAFKKLDEAFERNIQVRNQIADHIKEITKRNHEAYEKAKVERQKQEKERIKRKAGKEKRLSEIEAKINIMFYGFENVKKVSDESMNRVNETYRIVESIEERMDMVLNETILMRENSEAKDAEIVKLHDRINRQDKEIEILKGLIRDQQRMLELYMQFNAKSLNDRPF